MPDHAAIPSELLACMVVALGIIPETIVLSIVAGVDPQVGLFGSICILIVVSLLGGRPGIGNFSSMAFENSSALNE